MKRKGLLLLVLAALVAGGAFAQKVGDTLDAFGKNYTVQEVKNDGSLMLKPKAEGLDGAWIHTSGSVLPIPMGGTITFSDTTAVLSSNSTRDQRYNDAIKKGYWKVGEPVIRNIKSTGAGKWSCEVLLLVGMVGNNHTPTGAEWTASKIEMLPDGQIDVYVNATGNQRSKLKKR
jgi:hypothetical protein